MSRPILGSDTLWTFGTLTSGNTGLVLAAGTSPSIVGTVRDVRAANGAIAVEPDYFISYVDTTGTLFEEEATFGPAHAVNLG